MELVLIGKNKSKLETFTPDQSDVNSVLILDMAELQDIEDRIELTNGGLVVVDLESLSDRPGQIIQNIREHMPVWEVWAYYDSNSSSNIDQLDKLGYIKVIGFKDHPVIEIGNHLNMISKDK